MRCRSESVKRTVVDLSFSFFIAPDSLNRTIKLSLPRSKERQRRDGYVDISEVSLCEIFE